jgi:hypothetical protein
VFGLHWVATPIVLAVLIYLLVDLRRRLSQAPGVGWLDPLISEDGGIQVHREGRGRVARALVRSASWVGLAPRGQQVAAEAAGSGHRE